MGQMTFDFPHLHTWFDVLYKLDCEFSQCELLVIITKALMMHCLFNVVQLQCKTVDTWFITGVAAAVSIYRNTFYSVDI